MLPRRFTRLAQESTALAHRAASGRTPLTFSRQSHFQSQARPRLRLSSGQISNTCRHQRRNASFVANAKQLWRAHPYSVTLAFAIILFGAGTIGYANYIYQTYIIGAFHKFPEPVAVKLRRALYYTNTSLEPKNALKYYKQALQIADELGMDPFSDEIMGVKIQVAALMEKIQNYPKAIEVLEILRSDCLKWEAELGGLERNRGKRTRVLAKTVAISVKLGELYASPYIYEPEQAQERLVWAVETILKEKQRRETEGVKEDEGDWITDEELGASLEALAHSYEEKNQHYLATPLFLQALSLKEKNDCHTVVLMNNLSISLAQQSPTQASAIAASSTRTAPTSHAAMVENATQWAQKALNVAATLAPPERDEECDMGCAVATHNLGEFAEMNGDFAEAKRRYQEAIGLAKAIGFTEGQQNSAEGLRRVRSAAA